MFAELLGLAIVFISIYWYLAKPKNLPPGPSGVPILGYLPWILYYASDNIKLVEKLKKYGNVVCIRVGFSYMVFLYDMNNIKEAFVNGGDHFSGRGLKLVQSEVTHRKGILTSEGHYQRENRRFILKSLRNMGFGKMSFEEPIIESIKTMFESIDAHISKHPNKGFDIRVCLTEAVAENIAQIVLGIKFDQKELKFMMEKLESIQTIPQIFFMLNCFPFLLPLTYFKFFKNISGLEQFKIARNAIGDFVMKFVKNHKSNFDRDNISDFVYSYIEEQENHKNTEKEAYWWDDDQIKHACTELIGAGIGTTETTISWFLFQMANNQEWSHKVQKEIELVIGPERLPSTRDLNTLPLCEATILETLRWSSLVPNGIPHCATENTHLREYFIPKNTTVFSNLYNVSRDKAVWSDPDNFNPAANFLSSDQKVINRDKIIPFGIGRRSCVGESLARMEIILFFITIFQKYTVELDPKRKMASVINGLFRNASHRTIVFRPIRQ